MFQFLLVIQVIIAVALVGVILMQQSEGGGLTGGSPGGLMSARGATNFLTRATAILATLFIITAISLAVIATVNRAPSTIDTSLSKKKGALDAAPAATAPAANAIGGSPVPIAAPAAAAATNTTK